MYSCRNVFINLVNLAILISGDSAKKTFRFNNHSRYAVNVSFYDRVRSRELVSLLSPHTTVRTVRYTAVC
ncbi:MAG: hypothetical protein ABWZ79_01110 [Pedobacter agri]